MILKKTVGDCILGEGALDKALEIKTLEESVSTDLRNVFKAIKNGFYIRRNRVTYKVTNVRLAYEGSWRLYYGDSGKYLNISDRTKKYGKYWANTKKEFK